MLIISSLPEDHELFSEFSQSLKNHTGQIVIAMDRIFGGGNNQIYKLTCKADQKFIAKSYYRNSSDKRDRLTCEFSALQFMVKNGVGSVPKPIFSENKSGYAVYEFIDGEKPKTPMLTTQNLSQAAGFLITLMRLASQLKPTDITLASEACLSFESLIQNIELRIKKFENFYAQDGIDKQMIQFLRIELCTAYENLKNLGQKAIADHGINPKTEIELSKRTLSPSDFGFHNALRVQSGDVAFIDFEYFGWDDPVKMISDFLLHPGMNLNQTQCFKFSELILPTFIVDPDFMIRFKACYPLYAIKWCIIILNEFLKDQLDRRNFASSGKDSKSSLKETQLIKAKGMLQRVLTEYKDIPYALSS